MPENRYSSSYSRMTRARRRPAPASLKQFGLHLTRIIRLSYRGLSRRRPGDPSALRSTGWSILILAICSGSASFASSPIARDGGSIELAGVIYRLDGIDAPAFDQLCIDDHADSWACGVDARDQLARLIGDHAVRCEDLGPDSQYAKRRVGVCTVGETMSLNQILVRQGLAMNLEPTARGRFRADEADARENRRGLWKGCFVAPQEFRGGRKDGALLGGACRADKDREIREALFPYEPAMPPGCSVKGKFALRAQVTGNVGIYHVQACRSYPALTHPDRWFCSEDDAKAAGFRKAYNCRPFVRQRTP